MLVVVCLYWPLDWSRCMLVVGGFELILCIHTDLCLCVFRLNDWQPIINSLRINKSLQFVALRSYYQMPQEEDGGYFGNLVNFSQEEDGGYFGILVNFSQKEDGGYFGILVNFSQKEDGGYFGSLVNFSQEEDGGYFGILVNFSQQEEDSGYFGILGNFSHYLRATIRCPKRRTVGTLAFCKFLSGIEGRFPQVQISSRDHFIVNHFQNVQQ